MSIFNSIFELVFWVRMIVFGMMMVGMSSISYWSVRVDCIMSGRVHSVAVLGWMNCMVHYWVMHNGMMHNWMVHNWSNVAMVMRILI